MYAAVDHCFDCHRTSTPGIFHTCSTCSVTGTCADCGNTYHIYIRDRIHGKSYCVQCSCKKGLA